MLARIDLLSTPLELVEFDRLGLVGVERSLLLAVEPTQLGLPLRARRACVGLERVGLPGPLLALRGQRGRVVEQPLDVVPDGRVELLGPGPWLGAGMGAVPGEGVLAVAHVVAVLAPPAGPAGGDAAHGQAARPAGEQAAEQVLVAGVVAEGEARVPGQLFARILISNRVDDGRHRDGDPLLARAILAARRLARPGAGGPGPPRGDEHMPVG